MASSQTGIEAPERLQEAEQGEIAHRAQPGRQNVADAERWTSLASGALLALFGLSRRDIPGLLIAGVGGALLHRGATGYCYAYGALDIDTANDRVEDRVHRGLRVVQSYTISKSTHELYERWRDFKNLPNIMSHLESVRVIDEKRSHWVAKAPSIAGGKVEWDAEITQDQPGALIAWRSLPNADIENAGQVRFIDRGDRGTTVMITVHYVAPAGRLGKWVSKLFREEPEQQIHEDLRNFKRMMETGELPTIAGQPRGTCTGTGASPQEQ